MASYRPGSGSPALWRQDAMARRRAEPLFGYLVRDTRTARHRARRGREQHRNRSLLDIVLPSKDSSHRKNTASTRHFRSSLFNAPQAPCTTRWIPCNADGRRRRTKRFSGFQPLPNCANSNSEHHRMAIVWLHGVDCVHVPVSCFRWFVACPVYSRDPEDPRRCLYELPNSNHITWRNIRLSMINVGRCFVHGVSNARSYVAAVYPWTGRAMHSS